jgi:hypothetical protein
MTSLVVRNTFFHFVNECKDNETTLGSSACRSSSAPPSCRPVTCTKHDDAASCVSTAIENGSSTQDSDDGRDKCKPAATQITTTSWASETDSDSDCETIAGFDSDGDFGEAQWSRSARRLKSPQVATIASEAVQQNLDVMAQTVTQLWSTLNYLEAQMQDPSQPVPAPEAPAAPAPAAVACSETASTPKKEVQTIRLAAFLSIDSAVSKPADMKTKLKLNSTATLFKPSYRCAEVDNVLTSTKEILAATPNVGAVDMVPGIMGAIATLSIKVQAPTGETTDSMYLSVAKKAKAALLEAAEWSHNVYVLGYEATPFEDSPYGPSFSTALVVAPSEWECSACWDTYQQGVCPRGSTCKWQHPGRDEIQPLRVVFH